MTTRKVVLIGLLIILVCVLVEVLFVHPHADYWWHEMIAFDAIYGLLGCLVLIIVAKTFGKEYLQYPEDFYSGGEEDHD
ncbi:MAG: hypothetical protein ACOYJ1_08810 [Peptococcales bacterium]|jgi:hypothetical protein